MKGQWKRARLFVTRSRIVCCALSRRTQGFVEAVTKGPLTQNPVTSMRMALTDGLAHSVDSNELSFRQATKTAFRLGTDAHLGTDAVWQRTDGGAVCALRTQHSWRPSRSCWSRSWRSRSSFRASSRSVELKGTGKGPGARTQGWKRRTGLCDRVLLAGPAPRRLWTDPVFMVAW